MGTDSNLLFVMYPKRKYSSISLRPARCRLLATRSIIDLSHASRAITTNANSLSGRIRQMGHVSNRSLHPLAGFGQFKNFKRF
eukprot:scaffold9444_cov32-Prasinocladus_malaysianus.AAC.1